jgi:hypothetical protein
VARIRATRFFHRLNFLFLEHLFQNLRVRLKRPFIIEHISHQLDVGMLLEIIDDCLERNLRGGLLVLDCVRFGLAVQSRFPILGDSGQGIYARQIRHHPDVLTLLPGFPCSAFGCSHQFQLCESGQGMDQLKSDWSISNKKKGGDFSPPFFLLLAFDVFVSQI